MIDYHRTFRNEVGGALSIFQSVADVELVPTYSAFFITSGGTLAQDDWQVLSRDFLESIHNGFSAGVDGIYFCMHGAMCSEQEWDPEGYLLGETRRIVGEKIPIVESLDLHGIATRKMFQHADAIVAYHTYPHVDFFQTGARAARVPIPALVRGDELITETGLFGRCIAMAMDAERSPLGLSAGFFIGNPFTDVPELGTYSFVPTKNDENLARDLAMSIVERFWEYHEMMQVPLISLEQMQRKVLESPPGTTILVDAADATSSGSSSANVRGLGHQRCQRPIFPLDDIREFRPQVEIYRKPDVTKVGGLSEQRRIAWMAQDFGVEFVPHGWNTAVGLAADLHLVSAIPNTRFVEYLTGSPFIDQIVEEPWKLDQQGYLEIPDFPGLGVKLNLEAVAKYTGGTQWLRV